MCETVSLKPRRIQKINIKIDIDMKADKNSNNSTELLITRDWKVTKQVITMNNEIHAATIWSPMNNLKKVDINQH